MYSGFFLGGLRVARATADPSLSLRFRFVLPLGPGGAMRVDLWSSSGVEVFTGTVDAFLFVAPTLHDGSSENMPCAKGEHVYEDSRSALRFAGCAHCG